MQGQMAAAVAPPPFFIVGCVRSGTTLLQTLMDAHPALAIPPESHLFTRFSGAFRHYGDLRRRANLELLVRDLLEDERIKRWKLAVSVEAFCRNVPAPTLRDVIAHLYLLYARQQGKPRWGDKTPQHALCLREIHGLFPEAQFIHLVRDGRDVAESLTRVIIGKKSVLANAHRWREAVSACDAFKATVPAHQFLELRYESLVAQPEQEIARVFAFLGVPPVRVAPEGRVPETRLKVTYVKTLGSHHQGLLNPITESKIGVFRACFSRRELAIFESVAGDVLVRYGYRLVTEGAAVPVRWHEHLRFFGLDYGARYWRKIANPAGYADTARQVRETAQRKIRELLRSLRPATSTGGQA